MRSWERCPLIWVASTVPWAYTWKQDITQTWIKYWDNWITRGHLCCGITGRSHEGWLWCGTRGPGWLNWVILWPGNWVGQGGQWHSGDPQRCHVMWRHRGGDFGEDRSLVCALWPGCRLPPCGRQESPSFGCHECARTDRWCGQIRAMGISLVACEVHIREHHRGPHSWRRWQESAIWAGYNAGQGPCEATLSIHNPLTASIMRYYQGALYQRGYGLANLWRGIFKTAIPLLKSAGLAATHVGLRTGQGVVRDATRGHNLGEPLKRCLGS